MYFYHVSTVLDEMTSAMENNSSSTIDNIIACNNERVCIAGELRKITGKSKKKGSKRAPTEYNQFIGQCIKERSEGQAVSERMKECATKWKEKKRVSL